MTTSISLVRENAASLQPPRSLWVPFPLGRPLGVPNDAAFQHRVVATALALLERNSGPIVEDYAEDAPNHDVGTTMPVCPVAFPAIADDTSWQGRLLAELASLRPWYELGLRRRGRTLVGVSDSSVEEIHARLGTYLDADELPVDDLRWFKHAIEDVKAYYVEALTAQPGTYDPREIYATLWHKTQLGAGLRQFYDGFRVHPKLQGFARIVLPRSAVGESTG